MPSDNPSSYQKIAEVNGFTLVELVISITIAGVVASLVFFAMGKIHQGFIAFQRDMKTSRQLLTISDAIYRDVIQCSEMSFQDSLHLILSINQDIIEYANQDSVLTRNNHRMFGRDFKLLSCDWSLESSSETSDSTNSELPIVLNAVFEVMDSQKEIRGSVFARMRR